ncbi:synaptobrevin [Drepanopeziza brunnea f. sp. 'multigermtubi' MB_m1]|uniref:Synaptobrevin n=1 Tax=Marssonina brunnea f. sp. multigermtubi (strain MB_m1) TaxID=1072389 RepID=K1W9S9_MARBU|nr:synaptobrevin [Drepanopeziza brunnea f. sp. 'multigermtubi' MB_m1]EKD14010.1 synaptobrevin [Drepanopeziza brunnea f. sp. 'multigermtubi' MB_m1]
MARLSSANAPDPTAVNLTRLLSRLHKTLVTPDAETERRLQTSLERDKVGTNLDYARALLVRLEQDAQKIKVQSRKQETQADLVQKRELILRLSERLQEMRELGEFDSRDDSSSEGEDLLGEDTPSEETDSHADVPSATPSPTEPISPALAPQSQTKIQAPAPEHTTNPEPRPKPLPEPEPPSVLRARHKDLRAELLSPSSYSTGNSNPDSLSTATTEALLSHQRAEQEAITASLLSLATKMKESTRSFAISLEEEKPVLENATKGLEKNELGLEAAQRRMGYLRTMTEGKGWWGRMLMYAWIAGLGVVAILLVFAMPKLRF